MKKALIFLVFLVLVVFGSVQTGKSKVKSYYSGDALNYQEQLVIASTDSEALEVFTLEKDGLKKRLSLRPFNERFNQSDNFYDVKLDVDNGRLYAYAISGYTLYKYDISNLNQAVLIKKDQNTYWEWYNQLDKFGDQIITISAKGVKIFNRDLQVIDSYDITNNLASNISSNGDQDYIFNFKGDQNVIEIFSRKERSIVNRLRINFYGGQNNRAMYFDQLDRHLYFADDYSVKKISLKGELKETFEHLGYPGYDVSSSGNDYLYFANGLGVVKLKKGDLSVINSRRTGNLALAEGWAMGLKAVALKSGEKIVVFNNSSILVMDENLNLLGFSAAGTDDKVYAKENLFLNLSSASVESGSQFEVKGGGFLPGEKLSLEFYRQKYEISADRDGRFSKVLVTPELSDSASRNLVFKEVEEKGMSIKRISERTDIKVSGQQSNYTYSISLNMEDAVVNDK